MIGHVIRERREAAGLAMRELARMTGISAAFVSRLENVGGAASLEYAYRLAVALGCEVTDFLGSDIDAIRADVESRRESAIWRRQQRESRVHQLARENQELRARLAELGSA